MYADNLQDMGLPEKQYSVFGILNNLLFTVFIIT